METYALHHHTHLEQIIRDVMDDDNMCTEIILSAKPFRVKTKLSLKYLGASEF